MHTHLEGGKKKSASELPAWVARGSCHYWSIAIFSFFVASTITSGFVGSPDPDPTSVPIRQAEAWDLPPYKKHCLDILSPKKNDKKKKKKKKKNERTK